MFHSKKIEKMEKMIVRNALKSVVLVVMNLVVAFVLGACSTIEEPEVPVPAQTTEQETPEEPTATETPTGAILGVGFDGRYLVEGPMERKSEAVMFPVAYELRETVKTDTGTFVKVHHVDLRIQVSAVGTGVFAKDSVFMRDYCGFDWHLDWWQEKDKEGFIVKVCRNKLRLLNTGVSGWPLEFADQIVTYEMPTKFVSEYGYQISVPAYEITPEKSSFEVEKKGDKYQAKSETCYAVKHLSPELQNFTIPQYVELMFID